MNEILLPDPLPRTAEAAILYFCTDVGLFAQTRWLYCSVPKFSISSRISARRQQCFTNLVGCVADTFLESLKSLLNLTHFIGSLVDVIVLCG